MSFAIFFSQNLFHTYFQVSVAQEKTRHMIVLLAKLQKGKQNLESMKNEDKTVWEQKLKEVLQIKVWDTKFVFVFHIFPPFCQLL